VTGIITVSEYEKRVLLQYGVKEEKISTVYNGVDLEKFPFTGKPQQEVFNVGILARLSPEKNHGLFLEIAASMKEEKDLQFYIAGDGPERKFIQENIQKLGISDRVTLLGEVKEPQKFLQSMDLLLLTSEREVFPMVILEAMATGTPVVTINKGGISEAIADGETGMMVDNHCLETFCEKILSLKCDLDLRKTIIEDARKKVVRNFTSNHMVKHTIRQY
jgi:glycosyltransferase involved in cell wall biosynthesis